MSTTARDVGVAVGRLGVDTISVVQVRHDLLWVQESGEPFYMVQVKPDLLACQVSVHCSPVWSARLTAELAKVGKVVVAHQPWVQTRDGDVLFGIEAEAYWQAYKAQTPLLTARFDPTQPH